MKQLKKYKFLFNLVLGLQVSLLLLSALGFSHYYFELHNLKSTMQQDYKQQSFDKIKGKTLEEIISNQDLKQSLSFYMNANDKNITEGNSALKSLQSIEFWLQAYIATLFLSLIISGFVLYYLKKKIDYLVEKQILKIISKLKPLMQQYKNEQDWVLNLLVVLLDVYGLDKKYSDLIYKSIKKFNPPESQAA